MTQTYFRIQIASRNPADLVGTGQVSESWSGIESHDRAGVSVCASLADLHAYLACSGIPYGNGDAWVVVQLAGDEIESADAVDAEAGELLVHPTSIVAVRPFGAEDFDAIGAIFDAMA